MEDQNQENQTSAPSSNGSNKTMLMIVGAVGVIIIAVGAFFLTRSQTGTDEAVDTAIEEEVMEEETAGEGSLMEDGEAMEETDTATGDAMMEEDGEAMEEGARDITISGFSFGYNPSSLTMEAGERISLTFISEDAIHDFIVEGTDIATERIEGGNQTTIEFTAPSEPGEYTFYCSVGNHRAQGMEGTLTVE